MINSMKILFNFLFWQFLLVAAQDGQLLKCNDTESYPISDLNNLNGTWYVAATSPKSRYDCVESQVHLMDNKTKIHVTLRRSDNGSLLLKDELEAKFKIDDLLVPHGFVMDFNNQPKKFYKIVYALDDWIIMCSYANKTRDNDFGLILGRHRIPNTEKLSELKALAATLSSSFSKLADVKQSENCFNSGAIMTPITLMWALSYIIVKVF